MINECIEELRRRNITNIIGNHDYYLTTGNKCGRSYSANICLDYQRKNIKHDNLIWLSKSVSNIKLDKMWLVHGGWNDYLDEYITDYSFLSEKSNIDIYISGHTHIQKQVKGKACQYLNPGSIGQPRDKDPKAAFAIIKDDGCVELKRVEYNIDYIFEKMKSCGFEDRISSCLYKGVKIGED